MAQRFRTDLKDEIVQGGIKFWRAVTATGSILLKDFKMERTNANTQEGSAFGAKEANAIHAFLNGLLEGTETVKNAKAIFSGSNTIAPRWVPGSGIAFDVDATTNLPVANALRVNGMNMYAHTVTANPAGADSITIPLPSQSGTVGNMVYLSVTNSNAYASRAEITSVAVKNGGDGIVVAFGGYYTFPVQLSVLILTV